MRKLSAALLAAIMSFSPSHLADSENVVAAPVKAERPQLSKGERLKEKFFVSRSRATQTVLVKQYARWYALRTLGWSKDQFNLVYEIWMQESHWNWDAVNASSGASGIAQMMTSSKIKSPFRQVELGFKYVLSRYGTPEAAYRFKQENGWY